VLDTNIFISALGWEGKQRMLLRQIIDGKFELIISQHQLAELQKVLDYPKFQFSTWQKETFTTLILEIATLVETRVRLDIIKEDPADNRIIEAAVENGADFIITGDQHLLRIRKFHDTEIVTTEKFLEMTK
jgi:putative PIN family toxin of toxin-antitoxin system